MADNKFRYSKDNCPVCNQLFQADDDIVVCPVCGTPHHRECYKQNGACGNADKHSNGFIWESKSTEEAAPAENTNPVVKWNINDYNGELPPLPFNMEMPMQTPLKMFPAELEEGVSTEDAAVFVQQDATKYIQKFFYIKNGKNKWNWAAIFFAPYWFFYRKLYKHGAIVMAILLALSFLSYLPPVEKFLAESNNFYSQVVALNEEELDEQAYAQSLDNLTYEAQRIVTENKLGVGILAGQSLASIILAVFIGQNANKWYYRHVVKTIRDIRSKATDTDNIKQQIYKAGGYAFGITFLAILVEKIIIFGFDLILMALGL